MNPFLATFVLLAGLTQTSNSAGASVSAANYDVVAANGPVAVSYSTSGPAVFGEMNYAPDNLGGAAGTLEQAQRAVLVIPTPDLPPEGLADLTEDMTVMCRIFDKSLAPARAPAITADTDETNALEHYLSAIYSSRGPGTQGLYLDGYGALFFLDVDYPLVPTGPQESAPAKAAEPADSVWSQTIKEMSGQTDDRQQGGPSAPVYDALKVENLKKTLIRTLAHASNVRMRRPQDVIALVVGDLYARPRPTTSSVQAFSTNGRFRSSVTQSTSSSSVAARNPASALLVLRATKADVDAFAKGQLTLAQFTDKIQSLWSPANQATPATAPAPTTGARR